MFNNVKRMRKTVIECDKACKSLFAATRKRTRAAVKFINYASKEEKEDMSCDMINVVDGAQNNQHPKRARVDKGCGPGSGRSSRHLWRFVLQPLEIWRKTSVLQRKQLSSSTYQEFPDHQRTGKQPHVRTNYVHSPCPHLRDQTSAVAAP